MRGSQPLIAVGAGLDFHIEMRRVGLAEAAVGPVGGHNQIKIAVQVEVRLGLRIELKLRAQFRSAPLQNA